jgi:hypothetical protein
VLSVPSVIQTTDIFVAFVLIVSLWFRKQEFASLITLASLEDLGVLAVKKSC